MSLLACNQTNPLLEQPNTPFGVPAFDKVKIEHYLPAFEEAIRQNKAEIDAIVNNEDAPTFENTIVALDRSGLLLDRVTGVFFNVLEADGNDEMNAIAEQVRLDAVPMQKTAETDKRCLIRRRAFLSCFFVERASERD